MDLLKIIKNRRSIRHFKKRPLTKEIEEKLAEAIIWAPSAGNLQSRKFYFVKDKNTKEKLVRLALYQSFVKEAPLVVVACADFRIGRYYGERGINLYTICDTAASIQNLILEAHALGLGSCWISAFDEEKVKEILKIPDYLHPIAIFPVGYPAEKPEAPPRVSKDEAIEYR